MYFPKRILEALPAGSAAWPVAAIYMTYVFSEQSEASLNPSQSYLGEFGNNDDVIFVSDGP
jgi:hypothetical protein